jgi:hypothetical protein
MTFWERALVATIGGLIRAAVFILWAAIWSWVVGVDLHATSKEISLLFWMIAYVAFISVDLPPKSSAESR